MARSKRDDERVIYNIHNLNVYIAAEVVTQLNTNPQQIVNIIHEHIRAEIEGMTKKKIAVRIIEN